MLDRLETIMRTVALTTLVACALLVAREHAGREPAGRAEARPAAGEHTAAATGSAPIADEARRSDSSRPPALSFPLPDPPPFGDTYGDPRPGGRTHEGVDLMAPKRTPVHAAAAGTVRWLQDEAGGRCCALALEHENGWRTRYLHLDNDTPGTDDGLAVGIAPGLERGASVEAGELIGWVGDSGNAEKVGSHLHFELRDPSGRAVNATALLQAAAEATRREAEAASGRSAQ